MTATLRSFVDGDLSHAVPLQAVTEATQAILPDGRATVLLAADAVGSAEVVAGSPAVARRSARSTWRPAARCRCGCPRGRSSCR